MHPNIHNERLAGLDGLRALSILTVIYGHLVTTTPDASSKLLLKLSSLSYYGVQVFFVISGFLITSLLIREEREGGSLRLGQFYAKRALRILPPAIFFLGCLWFCGYLQISEKVQGILPALLFVRNYFPGSTDTAHFWSLAIEEQFYLGFPIVMLFVRKKHQRIILFTFLLTIAPFWQKLCDLTPLLRTTNGYRTDFQYAPILTGCLLAVLLSIPKFAQTLQNTKALWQKSGFCFFLVSVIGATFFLFTKTSGYINMFFNSISSVAVALLINAVISPKGRIVDSLLNWAPLRGIGKISFSLYIWQQIFCNSTVVGNGTWDFPTNLILTFGTAYLSYQLIERPCSKLRKKLFSPPPTRALSHHKELQLRPWNLKS